ncbi:glycoside hydrolase family 88 protein [Pelagicoccus albus]|uniref:Glycoside hydrolase family 88 protein n=1 Tax=Pelagicoccus albus TaxID=415222 RepID=A0A7X1B9D7_9BACT|nr:glycoside hydrolase family 88 protein [Pelagicoccus albus]MBC2608096.1 glycoside hydrolase family 88 protein [Pelagicoccus albus]
MKSHTCKTLLGLSLLLPCFAYGALESKESIASATLSNPSDFERPDQVVSFDLYDLGLREFDQRADFLIAKSNGVDVPSQTVDDDGDGMPDRFLALLDFEAAQSKPLEILVDPVAARATAFPKRTQAEISHKVGGQWNGRVYEGGEWANVQSLTPPASHTDHSFYIRYEGPGIESDLVGYRVYLDWRNGFDIFSKARHEIALHKVGLDGFDSYHELEEWGMDTLKVGPSLGMGSYGFWDGEKAIRVSDVDGWDASILQNGSIFSSFKIKYKGWEVDDRKFDLDATLSMQAGSRLVKVDLQASEPIGKTAIGLVKHEGTEFIQGDLNVSSFGALSYIATWGEQSLNKDQLGMVLIFTKGRMEKITEDEHNHIVVLKNSDQQSYYFGSVWESEPDGIKTKEDFVAYLENRLEQLDLPIRQEVVTSLDQANKASPISAETALSYSVLMAESEKARLGNTLAADLSNPQMPSGRLGYTTGLLMQAIDDIASAADRADLASYAQHVVESHILEDGTMIGYNQESYNIDNINAGKYLLRLWERSEEPKLQKAVDQLRTQLVDHPRTSEGAFWHKQIYPNQVWLDGVYMGMPFLAHYSELFEKGKSTKEAVHEFEIARKHMRDSKTGLYYHGWDESREQEWANKSTGLSPEFWARGYGWYTMAMVDILDFVPESEKKLRKSMIDMIAEVADSLVASQDPETGVWYQVMDKPDAAGNYTESSASSMFVYFLSKAMNKGYLSEDYKEAALKGYQGLIDEFITFHADGAISLKDVCKVAGLGYGRDGSFRYYMTEQIVDNGPHGTAPFIMAGIQVSELLAE